MTDFERKLRENPLFSEADIQRMLRKATVPVVPVSNTNGSEDYAVAKHELPNPANSGQA